MGISTAVAAVTPPNLHADGWAQFADLAIAFGLCAVIGLERELPQKSAGLRTHTLVGVGAALFMLVSKFGFGDVLDPGHSVVDPSRVAAQIVTGIGFLGAGLIFVRGGGVRGLTTAASVWVTAAVGAAAGAALPGLAAVGLLAYLAVTVGFPLFETRLPSRAASVLRVRYTHDEGALRELLKVATDRGFTVGGLSTDHVDHGTVEVELRVRGKGSTADLASALSSMEGVRAVLTDDSSDDA